MTVRIAFRTGFPDDSDSAVSAFASSSGLSPSGVLCQIDLSCRDYGFYATIEGMITGPAHTGVCVPGCEAAAMADQGLTHVGLVCDNLDETRKSLKDKGVHFLVDGNADIEGVRTTWFADPWGVVFILVEKRKPERPYFAQVG